MISFHAVGIVGRSMDGKSYYKSLGIYMREVRTSGFGFRYTARIGEATRLL